MAYTGPNGFKILYEASYKSGWNDAHDPLSVLMYFHSWNYVGTDFLEYPEGFRTDGRAMWNRQHIKRGGNLGVGDAHEKLSSDLRLYVDAPNTEGQPVKESDAATDVICTGMSCTATIGKQQNVKVLNSKHFLPSNDDKVHVVLPHQGIYLTLDATEEGRPIRSPFSFGAWMDDVGFFVVPRGNVGRLYKPARMVAVIGERTGDRPAKDAAWRGSMVGTALKGLSKDNLLRGEAELKFDMSDSTLDAYFFNIRDYDRFGELYMNPRGQKQDQLLFEDIPVAADGSYARQYNKRVDKRGGNIRGAFYGANHHETAGTFRQKGILGTFGAKKVEKAPAN